jgi:Ca2+-binding EF-hand superfamily protein
MVRFENTVIKGTHASRYIMSYLRSGGEIRYSDKFEQWLKALPLELTEEEIDHIVEMYNCGKIEFEFDAQQFLKNYKEPEYEI